MQVAFAQDRQITGTVSESNGAAIPGASVLVKGTTVGTITDFDGKYMIKVPADATVLVYSFVGMETKEVNIGDKTNINVVLDQENIGLNEVVVTAMGIERSSKSLSYAVSNVGGEETQQKSEPDLLKSLQGKVAGVQIQASTGTPGAATRITIRGNSSFLGNNQPLIVVDGIPYSNDQYNTSNQLTSGAAYSSGLSTIDPNNIESIQVLKGAAAAALYGSRAANGVLLIKTKSGSASSKKGMEVTLTSSLSFEQISNLPDYQNTYGNGFNWLEANSNGSWGPKFSTIDSIPLWPDWAAAFPDMPRNVPYEAHPNNVKDLFETGVVSENSISINGGTGSSSLNITASYLDHKGFIPHSKYNKGSIAIGGSTKLENGLKASGSFSYSKSQQEGPLLGANNAADAGAATSFARTMFLGRTWDMSLPYEHPVTGESLFPIGGVNNPLWSWAHDGLEADVDRILATMDLSYDVFDWLNVKYKIGVNTYNDRRKQVTDIGSIAYNGDGSVIDEKIYSSEIESNLSMTITKRISDDLNVRAVLGHNVNQYTRDRQATFGRTLVSPDIFDIDNCQNVIPNGGTYYRTRLWGIYGDISIEFKDYLFVNLTGRNDWSSTLPESEKSFFYPSVSTSFIFTDAFGIKNDILSSGKIRVSWAKVANSAGAYSLDNTFSINLGNLSNIVGAQRDLDFPFKGLSTASWSAIANDPNLKPEFTTEYEIGTMLDFLNGKINLDLTYYNRSSTDQIVNISLPNSTGYQQLITNAGELQNQGIEIGLSLTPVSLANGFTWDIYTTFTRNISEVIELPTGVERINVRNLYTNGITPVIEKGEPYGILRGSVVDRDDEGNLLIDPANGELIRATDLTKVGDPNPDFLLGITNTFSWKGITLSTVFDYKHRGDLYSVTVNSLLGRGVTKDTEDRDHAWIIPGVYGDPNTHEVILDENGQKIENSVRMTTNDLWFGETFAMNGADEWSVYDATVIRLREISLSYALPKKLFDKIPIGSASISLTGRNLWFWAPHFPEYSNFDPEVNSFGATNTQGLEYTAAPSQRRYGINLKLTF